MPECDNPLWPCAMTGAAACLAGISGISVVIHGSSGCYYYPATLLKAPLFGTFILEKEVIFGSEDRLCEVIGDLAKTGNRIAVITTCVPAILGEDVKAMVARYEVLLVDSPGFAGDAEVGYAKALSLLEPAVDPARPGINIDGACLLDPFSRGNVQEMRRLLSLAGIPVGVVLCDTSRASLSRLSPFTLGTNTDFRSNAGEYVGGTLGFSPLKKTFGRIGEVIPEADGAAVLSEIERQEEALIHACDKYLRRFNPPSVVIFAGSAYAGFAADTLKHYLDADIRGIGLRNPETSGLPPHFPHEYVASLSRVKDLIETHAPDLVFGSSFERSVTGNRGFVGLIPPLRGEVRLAPRPLAGINGTLSFMEDVLNTCMDQKVRQRNTYS
ncbi:MAG: oxidoreductase [Methanomicrobiales archaeon]|nr:oxidoreductase [Methanomicrobiales archaeon]